MKTTRKGIRKRKTSKLIKSTEDTTSIGGTAHSQQNHLAGSGTQNQMQGLISMNSIQKCRYIHLSYLKVNLHVLNPKKVLGWRRRPCLRMSSHILNLTKSVG